MPYFRNVAAIIFNKIKVNSSLKLQVFTFENNLSSILNRA